jgi:hypothetical protein
MAEYLQVWKARVDEANVERLLELRPAAIAEAQRLCPELLAAELVHLEDGTWLAVLRCSRADGASSTGWRVRAPSPANTSSPT